MRNLFTYGSLMCEDIMFAVTGDPLRRTPALLSGYRRFLVQNEQYPGVVPSSGGQVQGIVYHDISPKGWSRLDRFEGDFYTRSLVAVRYEMGDEAMAYCYVFRSEFRDRLTGDEWNFETFLRGGKKIFQTQYSGFKDI